MIDLAAVAPLTIVALGDSTTAGTPGFRSPVEAPPDGEGDPTSQFAWWMMRAEPAWTVINRGVNGERSDEILARVERDVLAHAPDLLIVLAGVNDVYQGRSAVSVQTNLTAIYARARAAQLPIVACSVLPYDTATADQRLRLQAINAWIRDLAVTAPDMVFCDTRAAVTAPNNRDRLLATPDGLHPDAAGYRRMAEALVPAVRLAIVRAEQ